MLLIIYVFPLVLPAILPSEGPRAVHLVVPPFPVVFSFVGPIVDAYSMDVVVGKCAYV